MKTLKVWLSSQTEDHSCYNIVARTKTECWAEIARRSWREYSPPRLIEIEYEDAFDLFELVTGEGGGRHGLY